MNNASGAISNSAPPTSPRERATFAARGRAAAGGRAAPLTTVPNSVAPDGFDMAAIRSARGPGGEALVEIIAVFVPELTVVHDADLRMLRRIGQILELRR